MMEFIAIYWVKVFATLAIFIVLVILFLRDGGLQSGISAAELVNKELSQLGDSYIIFDNVIVQSERSMSLIPHVIVSPYGVFVVSICDLPGKIFGNKNDQEWQIKHKGVNDTILNPLWGNRKYINALEKKIGSRPFIPIVIFTHAKLANDFGPIALSADQLQEYFSGHKEILMGSNDQKSIINILKS